MIQFDGKVVEVCGWAGPLLWVCTTDNYSIHLFDSEILLNDENVHIGMDINKHLSDKVIEKLLINSTDFSVIFSSGDILKINSASIETARVFKQKSKDPHYIYENGKISYD